MLGAVCFQCLIETRNISFLGLIFNTLPKKLKISIRCNEQRGKNNVRLCIKHCIILFLFVSKISYTSYNQEHPSFFSLNCSIVK